MSTPPSDDLVAPFQLETEAAHGRIVRLGPVVDEILTRHAYPEPVANLLGEACVLAALVGSGLKGQGRLIVQAQGNGAVPYVVADYDAAGGLRGYCRFDADKVAELSSGFSRPGAQALLGDGVFVMTVDPADGRERYQGVTAIEGETLALSAEQYFAQSEQSPAKVRLAVAEQVVGDRRAWRAGGVVLQKMAGDDARGSTVEGWENARALFSTLADDEMTDPATSPQTLLFRLFHEDGVRLFQPRALSAFCRCSQERVTGMLASFPAEDRAGMVEPDGAIHVTCEYCSRAYVVDPAVLAEPAQA